MIFMFRLNVFSIFFSFILLFSFGCLEEEEESKDFSDLDFGLQEENKEEVIEEEFEYIDYPDYDIFEMEKNIHELINAERISLGLSELEFDEHLALIARKHSKDMAENNFFSHYDLKGKDFSYRYEQSNYDCKIRVGNVIHLGAENLFKYNIAKLVYSDGRVAEYNSQAELEVVAVEGWMNSPGHRENIEKDFWLKEGLGVYIDEEGEVLVTQNFC